MWAPVQSWVRAPSVAYVLVVEDEVRVPLVVAKGLAVECVAREVLLAVLEHAVLAARAQVGRALNLVAGAEAAQVVDRLVAAVGPLPELVGGPREDARARFVGDLREGRGRSEKAMEGQRRFEIGLSVTGFFFTSAREVQMPKPHAEHLSPKTIVQEVALPLGSGWKDARERWC